MQAAQLGAGVATGAVQYVGMPGKNMVANFPVLSNGLRGVVPAEAFLVVQRILIVFDGVLQVALLGVIGGFQLFLKFGQAVLEVFKGFLICLLYTSDAADEL